MTNYASTLFSREFAARIRGLIARYDINQADLAVLCDVSQSQFSKMVRGVRPMTLDHAVVICEALGADIGEIMEEVQTFVNDRVTGASPITFVSEGERTDVPFIYTNRSHLDGWGQAGLDRLIDGGTVVPSDEDGFVYAETPKQSHHALAAKRGRRKVDVPHAD